MRTHNELSQVTVTFSAFDEQGQSYVPNTASYKLTDCKTEDLLIDWTSVPPEKTMTIVIPGSANAILSDHRRTEVKVVTVRTNEGQSGQHYAEYEYRIENLKFVGD